jgi:hypothetical protein
MLGRAHYPHLNFSIGSDHPRHGIAQVIAGFSGRCTEKSRRWQHESHCISGDYQHGLPSPPVIDGSSTRSQQLN